MRKQLRPLVLLTCITAATAFGSSLAIADTAPAPAPDQHEMKGEHQHRKGHQRFFKKMAKELGLSDQQKSQAKALFASNHAQNKPLFEAVRNARHDLRGLTESGSADEAAIRAQAAKLASAEAELAVKRAQGTKEFLALLTPDQVTKLKALRAKREVRFQKGEGKFCDGKGM